MGVLRRSPAEKKLAEEITAQAKTKRPDPAKFARAKRYAEEATRSQRFEYNRLQSTHDGLPIHYFHDVGESVVGILGEPSQEMWKGWTYPLVQDDGRVIRLPGNRRLLKAIDKADAIGQRVKITYKGKLFTRYGGHYEKVYLLELAPLAQEPMTPAGRELLQAAAAEARAKKEENRD